MKGLLYPVYFFCIIILPFCGANAQYDNVWAFGRNAGIDFNKTPPEPIRTSLNTSEGSAVVCNMNGDLLFYTDGTTVWDKDNNPMSNGNNLTGVGNITASCTQGALIIPIPGNDAQYYIFSLGQVGNYLGRLSYSIVDMSLNNGMGDVLANSKAILIDTIYTEHMSAVPGNNCNVWLMVVDRNKNKFHAFSINAGGIDKNPVLSDRVFAGGGSYQGHLGSIDFSPDRTKMAMAQSSMLLYDFDADRGTVSNPVTLDANATLNYYGAAFSPDGSKLYGSTASSVYQFDLSSGVDTTMAASKTLIGSTSYPAIRRAPDGKIYCASSGMATLHVIEKPDEAGTACRFVPNGFALLSGTLSNLGLPNMLFGINLLTLRSKFSLAPGQRDTGCAPYTVELRNTSTEVKSYYWDFGDGRTSTERNPPPYTYDTPGTYRIMLAIFNDGACKGYDTAYRTITIFAVEYPDLEVSDTILCHYEQQIDIGVHINNPSPYNVISWEPAAGVVSQPGQAVVRVDLLTSHIYYVTVRDTIPGICGFSATDTVRIDLSPRDLRILTHDTTVCEGYVLPIVATGTPGYTYRWSPSTGINDTTVLGPEITILQPEVYNLTASYPGCLDTTVAIKVDMHYMPRVDAGPDKSVCQGTEVALESKVTPYRNDYAYQWSPADKLNTPDSPNADFIADSSGTYRLLVTTPMGCAGSDLLRVTVYPGGFGRASRDTGFCLDNAVGLWADGGITYIWTPAYGLSDTTVPDPLASPGASTQYTVYITDIHNCVDTEYVFVQVYPAAILTLPDSVSIYSGEQYQVEPETNCFYFRWFPPSGITNTEIANPVASPEVRTRYFVTAGTEQGCMLRDSIDILVEGTIIDMPNAFTPTGSYNTFKPSKRGIAELKSFSIYNRWGARVFSTTNIEEGWDGTYKGTPQPLGVYVYAREAITDSGKVYIKRGNVTLVK